MASIAAPAEASTVAESTSPSQAQEAALEGPTSHTSPLSSLIALTSTCSLRPLAFFCSWSGVLTLAYTGYPDALRTLKQNINNSLPSLVKEAPGSRWPKTSLGCLKEGTRLTPAQLETLNNICTQESGVFQHPQSRRSQAVLVDQLEIVLYECRCLERRINKHVVPLRTEVDISEPSMDEKARVHAVLAEMDAPDYWFHASRDGNRETHYRGTALGATLVHELAAFTGRTQAMATAPLSRHPSETSVSLATKQPQGADLKAFSCALPSLIRAFKARVDKELPGVYTWFAEESLHVTIRAIM